jgi:uncharacterized protein YidB (DUF937 family)
MMARPSMTALLALLAVAGYQNRDKLAGLLGSLGGGAGGQADPRRAGPAGEGGRFGGQMGAEAGGVGGLLSGGLRELLDQFRQAGHGEAADSWVSQGPNRPVAPNDLERAIGADTLETLSRQTGLPREEILARLSRELPQAVDRYTPDGRLPDV